MEGRRYNHSGMDNAKFGNIPPNSEMNLSGMGNVKIDNVGEGTLINHSSMGNVRIDGTVGRGVIINHSGVGNLIFEKMPPDDVINNIRHTGMGSIKYPGGTSYAGGAGANMVYGDVMDVVSVCNNGGTFIGQQSTNGKHYKNVMMQNDLIVRTNDQGLIEVIKDGAMKVYKGDRASIINSVVVIDGKPVSEADARLVETKPYEQPAVVNKGFKKGKSTYYAQNVGVMGDNAKIGNIHVGGHSVMFAPSVRRQEPPKPVVVQVPPVATAPAAPAVPALVDRLSAEVNIFAAKLSAKTSHAEMLANKKMSAEERTAFVSALPDLFDKKSNEILNVPVTVNGEFYELNVLTSNPADADGKRHTADGKEYRLSDIKPASFLVEAIHAAISTIEEPRSTVALK